MANRRFVKALVVEGAERGTKGSPKDGEIVTLDLGAISLGQYDETRFDYTPTVHLVGKGRWGGWALQRFAIDPTLRVGRGN